MTGRRRLVVNADDFGFTAEVNRGISDAHRDGIVTSTSLMVGCPGWTDALHRLPELPALGVGLHLDLLVGPPVSRCRSLIDRRTGRFHSFRSLLQRAISHRVNPADVEMECEAQLDRLRMAGVSVTHVDSHRHTHVFPRFFDAVRRAAGRAGIGVVRVPLEPFGIGPNRPAIVWRKALVHAILSSWTRADSVAGFVGTSLTGNATFQSDLLGVLDRIPEGTTELMVHPGYPSSDLAEVDTYLAGRQIEVDALTSVEVRQRIQERDIELITFGQL